MRTMTNSTCQGIKPLTSSSSITTITTTTTTVVTLAATGQSSPRTTTTSSITTTIVGTISNSKPRVSNITSSRQAEEVSIEGTCKIVRAKMKKVIRTTLKRDITREGWGETAQTHLTGGAEVEATIEVAEIVIRTTKASMAVEDTVLKTSSRITIHWTQQAHSREQTHRLHIKWFSNSRLKLYLQIHNWC